MNHVVLTRAAYGPDWSLEANRARLAITAGVTARLMALQTSQAWTWRVLVDERDELLAERKAVFEAAAPGRVEFLEWIPPAVLRPATWDKHPDRPQPYRELLAAEAYTFPGWRDGFDPLEPLFQTRLDDDDGFTLNAIARIQKAGHRLLGTHRARRRLALMLPVGYRTYRGRVAWAIHKSNAWVTLYTPPGDTTCVYDFGHNHVRQHARVIDVDQYPGWLWVRHDNTLSGFKRGIGRPLTRAIRQLFPIDWTLVGAAA